MNTIERLKNWLIEFKSDPRDFLSGKHLKVGVILVLLGFAAFGFFKYQHGLALQAAQKKEDEEIEIAKKLVALKVQLEDAVKELAKKRSEVAGGGSLGRGRVSPRLQLASNAYVGFTPQTGFQEITKSKKDFYIPRGSVFQARTLTSIKTSITESFVVAETTQTFELDRKRRIPKGTRLIGSAKLNPVLKGLIVRFDTMVLPSGKQIDGLRLLALDHRAFPELEGIFFSDKAEVYGTAMAFGFLSGFSSAGQEREATSNGSVPTPSIKNQVLGGLSAASFSVAEDMLKDIKDKAVEYVILPAGETCFVVFEEKLNVDSERGFQ